MAIGIDGVDMAGTLDVSIMPATRMLVQRLSSPASTAIVDPVMYRPADDFRNTTTAEMSSGSSSSTGSALVMEFWR